MKKLLIVLAISATFMACNNAGEKDKTDEVAADTVESGENISADAQQSSVDTNVNKIGTSPTPVDSSKKDSVNR